jgi:hypothetical protein
MSAKPGWQATRATRRWVPAIAAILAIPALLGAVAHFWWPLRQDHGVFLWVGETIRSGGLPYRDAWDVKGPVAYLPFAALGYLPAFAAKLRLLDFVLVGFGIMAVGRLAKRLNGSFAIAGGLLGLWLFDLNFGNSAQPDAWFAFLVAWAVLGVIGATPGHRRDLVVLGAAVAAAVLFKPTYLVLGAVLLVVLAYSRALGRSPAAALALVASGAVVVGALVLGWLACHDGLQTAIDVQLGYTTGVYAGQATMGNRVQWMLAHLVREPHLSASLGLSALALLWLWRTDQRSAFLMAAWLGGGLVAFLVQGKFFPYHHGALYPSIAVLCSVGVSHAVRPGRSRAGALVSTALLLVITAGPFYRLTRQGILAATAWFHGQPVPGTASDRSFGKYGRWSGSLVDIAELIRVGSDSGETLQVWGQNAGLYVLSGRRAPTRFGTSQPLVSGSASDYRRIYREEFLRVITSEPPRYVVARSPEGCRTRPDDLWCLSSFPEFERLVALEYLQQSVVEDFAVYRRRDMNPRSQ